VRVYGDTAVVTGRSVQRGMENGKDNSGTYWFTRVHVKQNGQWLTVALPTPPSAQIVTEKPLFANRQQIRLAAC